MAHPRMEIEEIAQLSPDKIVKETIDPAVGLLDFQCRKVATAIGLRDKHLMPQAVRIMKRIYRLFRDKDALQIEINPLGLVSHDRRLICLDAKCNFDPNALYRHPEINELRDLEEEDPKEMEASGHGLNYIALDGNIGCIVNGAGLAMATMDAITLHGGRPANFLDIGGGASPEKVMSACRIVMEDANVQALLVNILAGINRCDWIATGLVQAYVDLKLDKPCVVRLAGTNVEEGHRILVESGLPFIQAANLDDAAAKAVEPSKRGSHEHFCQSPLASHFPRLYWTTRFFSCPRGNQAWHLRSRRCHPRQRRNYSSWATGIRYSRRNSARDWRGCLGNLCPASICRRCYHGGHRRWHQSGRTQMGFPFRT